MTEAKRYRKLPWEDADPFGAPIAKRRWYPNPTTGLIHMLEEKFFFEDSPTGNGKTWVTRGYDFRPDFMLMVLTTPEVEKIYALSAKNDWTLMKATVDFLGKNTFPPVWIKQAEKAAKFYAEKKYDPAVAAAED